MYENPTGDSPFTGGNTVATVANTHVNDARCDNYDTRYVASGAAIRPKDRRENCSGQGDTVLSSVAVAGRYNIARWTDYARECSVRLESASRGGDFMEATNAGVELAQALEQLWRHRESREDEFAEIVNMLQIALAKLNFEQLSGDQCAKIVELIDKSLLSGAVDETEVRNARVLLRQAGLDPWRGLSLNAE